MIPSRLILFDLEQSLRKKDEPRYHFEMKFFIRIHFPLEQFSKKLSSKPSNFNPNRAFFDVDPGETSDSLHLGLALSPHERSARALRGDVSRALMRHSVATALLPCVNGRGAICVEGAASERTKALVQLPRRTAV